MFTKNKFQYYIYNHERLELHDLQNKYQNDKVLQNLSMNTNYSVRIVSKSS